MGKKTRKNNDDDYWNSGFEQDLNALTVEDPIVPEEEPVSTNKKSQSADRPKGKKPVAEREKEGEEKKREKKGEEKKKEKETKPTSQPTPQPASEPASEPIPQELPSQPNAPQKLSKRAAQIEQIRQMQARKAAIEQEQQRLAQEELAQQQLEQQQALAQEALKEEAKREKKEKEKAEKEALKKQGLLLTKSQREKKERDALKLEQLKAAGNIKIAALQQPKSEPGQLPKRPPVYSNKKKKPVSVALKEQKELTEAQKQEAISTSQAEEQVPDNWDDESSSCEQEQLSEENCTGEETERIQGNKLNAQSRTVDQSRTAGQSRTVEQCKKADQSTPITQTKASNQTDQATSDPSIPSEQTLRSPICCILGHVDTGKTKLLDKIRQTNVQEGEAGGITQQIGATYFPIEAIKTKTAELITDSNNSAHQLTFNIPGLLVIDTPGHESFTNLRSRGSSLCNIAILVIDITAGLEAQTLESLNLLKMRKTPFVVALNKIDRIYGWKSMPNKPIQQSLAAQSASVIQEYNDRVAKALLALSEQGLNSELYYKNKNFRKYVSVVPTSAITGEGIPDLLMLIVQLTQKIMSSSLLFLSESFECTVLEVKVVEGLGTTIDCVLSNGILREGDRIAVCGLNGPIVTTIRAILTPQPLRELRIKSQYQHHKQVAAALGVKISAPDLEKAVAGSRVLLLTGHETEEELADLVMGDLNSLLNSVDKSGVGVCVQASTLGSLEALLQFLQQMSIPVSGISIGPVHKKDVIRAGTMLERSPEHALILAFDVKVEREAAETAEELGVKIFTADIIYHLFDKFTQHARLMEEGKKKEMQAQAVFPCILRIQPGCVFNTRDPIILGVNVVEGQLRVGTPLCVPSRDGQPSIGKVTSIELNHKAQHTVRRGTAAVAIKIDCESWDTPKMVGRHFEEKDELCSKLTRASIDVLKEHFRQELDKDDWQLVVKLKKQLNIS